MPDLSTLVGWLLSSAVGGSIVGYVLNRRLVAFRVLKPRQSTLAVDLFVRIMGADASVREFISPNRASDTEEQRQKAVARVERQLNALLRPVVRAQVVLGHAVATKLDALHHQLVGYAWAAYAATALHNTDEAGRRAELMEIHRAYKAEMPKLIEDVRMALRSVVGTDVPAVEVRIT